MLSLAVHFFLLVGPLAIYWLGKYAVSGLFRGTTWTEFGTRTGLLARLWGFYYLLNVGLLIFVICFSALTLLQQGLIKIITILLLPLRMYPEAALLFIGLGLLFAVFGYVSPKLGRKKTNTSDASSWARQWYMYLWGLVIAAIGIFSWIGLPMWADILTLILLTYVSIPLWLKFRAA